MIFIREIEYYLPKNKIDNNALKKNNANWDIDEISIKTGVQNRYIAGEDETSLDLAIVACNKLLSRAKIDKDKIDGLIFCTQSPDYIMPPNSSILHGILGLKENVFAYDFNLACSGYVYGLAMINGLIESNILSNVLFINADTYSKFISDGDRSTKVLFGDAASVSLIQKSKGSKGVFAFKYSTSGENYNKFIIPAGGMRVPKSPDTKILRTDRYGNSKSNEKIHMNGMGIFAFVNTKVPKQINALLSENNLEIKNINLFIFHQASKLAIDALSKILKLDSSKVFTNIELIGNTVSASIPIAIKDAQDEGLIKENDIILCSGFGVGLSWASCLIRF